MNKLITWLILNHAIKTEEKELYIYGIKNMLLLPTPLLLALVYGVCFHLLKESILVVLPFMILRKYCGGHHARFFVQCLIQSSILIGASIWLAGRISNLPLLHMLVGLSIFSLIIHSPIDSEKRKLTLAEKRRFKSIVVVILSIYLMLYICLNFFKLSDGASCLGIGIILSACMQIPCIFRNYHPINTGEEQPQ